MLGKKSGWSIVTYSNLAAYLTFTARFNGGFRVFVLFGAFVTVEHNLF